MSGLKIASLVEQIAALDISGVIISATDAIPVDVLSRDVPLMYPKPNGFISGLTITREAFGLDSSANTKKNVIYTMTWVFCYEKIGSGRGLFESYPDFVDKAAALLDGLAQLDTTEGVIDITPAPVVWGVVQDPSGNAFHGAEIALNVLEFYEV